jgi:hypothetical protein
MKKLLSVMTMVLILLVAAFPLVANAIPVPPTATLSLWDGTNYVEIVDNGTGDTSSLWGVVTYNDPVGNWIVTVSTGLTKPILGGGLQPSMDLSSVDVSYSGTAPGTLKIAFSDVGFNNGALPYSPNSKVNMHVGGTTQGSFTYQAYFNNSNVLLYANSVFDTATLIDSLGIFSTPSFSGSSTNFITTDSAFSLTEFITITHPGGNIPLATSINAALDVFPVPVPASVLLLGSGLVGLVGLRYRRKRQG